VAHAPLIGAGLGCTAIQLFTSNNQQWRAPRITKADIDGFHRNMEEGGIRAAFAHAIYLINLAAPDPAVYRRSLAAMIREIERADQLDLPFVVIHPGSHRGRGLEWGIRRVAESINRVFDRTRDRRAGITLETTAGQGFSIGHAFEHLAQIIDLVEQGDRLSICFDTCHAFVAGYELRTEEGYRGTWRRFDGIIGRDRLVAIHLNDSKGDLGSRIDRHQHIGKGRIGLAGFRLLLHDPGLASIPMVIETPKEDDALKYDAKNLRTLRRLISSWPRG
jgi:deoxyribonuclease-4